MTVIPSRDKPLQTAAKRRSPGAQEALLAFAVLGTVALILAVLYVAVVVWLFGGSS